MHNRMYQGALGGSNNTLLQRSTLFMTGVFEDPRQIKTMTPNRS